MSLYYEVLIQISLGYPSVKGRLHTRYAPVRRSLIPKNYTPRLACVKPAASVHPEPGSNSSSYIVCSNYFKLLLFDSVSIGLYSNLSILLLLFFCFNISVKTAVNSICLGTYSAFFYSRLTHIVSLSKRVQKYKLFL